MPNNTSPPITAEDMMASSALSVSPLLTHSIFEEITTSDSGEVGQLMVGYGQLMQHSSSRSTHFIDSRSNFIPPPPSARWTRRLSSLHRTVGQEIGLDSPVNHPSQSFPYSATAHFIYGQNCLNGRAVQMSPILAREECYSMKMLDFDIISDDGGQYGSLYGIENLLLNDGSVYCSGRKGVINILMQYCGYIESGITMDTSCSINKIVLKAPQHGFTAPCKEGMIFISHKEIDIEATRCFDGFSEDDYIRYKEANGVLDDEGPAAWFTLESDRVCILDLNNRSGKYVLLKMLRSDHESDNIDLQYAGFIGFSGPRSFGSSRLC